MSTDPKIYIWWCATLKPIWMRVVPLFSLNFVFLQNFHELSSLFAAQVIKVIKVGSTGGYSGKHTFHFTLNCARKTPNYYNSMIFWAFYSQMLFYICNFLYNNLFAIDNRRSRLLRRIRWILRRSWIWRWSWIFR